MTEKIKFKAANPPRIMKYTHYAQGALLQIARWGVQRGIIKMSAMILKQTSSYSIPVLMTRFMLSSMG